MEFRDMTSIQKGGLLFALILPFAGCGGPRPVTGGTDGSLKVGNIYLAETQVTVYQRKEGSWQALGFAITDSDGTFQLATNGARGPLRLPAGEFCVTLESAGAPVQFPEIYAKPETSPLQITRIDDFGELELTVPDLRQP